ncbi:MAG: M20 family peptidase [Spirochaetaceae bacterium]|nr:MAG: M20 family peptidase [Spirochaetaceae bacterium]
MKKKLFVWAGVAVLAVVTTLLAAVVIRTATLISKQLTVESSTLSTPEADEMAARLAGALRFHTVSYSDPSEFDARAFYGLHDYLEDSFPAVHAVMEREAVGKFSLLYTWQGSDPTAAPMLFLGHLDVVPAAEAGDKWEYPPFAGRVEEGFIWGRGAMDDKLAVTGLLESAEALIKSGFTPSRTIYLAFGHDEETGGQNGARQIVELLVSRGIQAEFALDEGLIITDGIMPGVASPVALIGIAEKGTMFVELTAHAAGGHSSMPPAQTAVGTLAQALIALNENPLPSRLVSPIREMFAYTAPEMSLPMKAIFGNMWLFEGLVRSQMAAKPSTNAQVRTTTAPTMLWGSPAENVLPNEARAVVNYRLLSGDTIDQVLEYVQDTVDNPNVKVSLAKAISGEASQISTTDSRAFETIHKTVKQVFPQALVAPSMMVGYSDSRQYSPVAKDIYRFVPIVAQQKDLDRIHGINERLSVENYQKLVAFYMQFIMNCAGLPVQVASAD